MNIEEFESFLDRHGPDPSLWPKTSESDSAKRLIEASAGAREVLATNQRLYDWFTTAFAVRTPIGLQARILDAVEASQKNWWSSAIVQWLWKPALAALPIVIGFMIGILANNSISLDRYELPIGQFEEHGDLNELVVMSDE